MKKIYKVKIPNYEIKFLFSEIIDDWFRNKVIGNDLNSILKDKIDVGDAKISKIKRSVLLLLY